MRPKLLTLLLVALAAGLAWVVAPALSLTPYMPPAVDFEQAVPAVERLPRAPARTGGAHAGEPPARWISPVVEAPHRFDLVGVAGELRPVEFRAREDGSEWSPWVEAADGDPVYFGGAEELQLRASFRPSGRLHYVNVSGTAGGGAETLLHEVRGGINSAFISAASAPLADARAPRPRFVTRSEWGATMEQGGCPPRAPAAYGEVRAGVVHHTVTGNEYTPEEAPGIVLGICRYHLYGNGWNDIGYQALVDRFGRVYKGRAGGMGKAVVGAQAQGFNSQTTGIASIGTHTSEAPTRRARNGIVRHLAWKLELHRAVPATKKTKVTSAGGEATQHPEGTVLSIYRVVGHRRLNTTVCPGGALYRQVAGIRKLVQRRIKKFAS